MRNILIVAAALLLSAVAWAQEVPRSQQTSVEDGHHRHSHSPRPDCHKSSIAGMEECAGMYSATDCIHACCFEQAPETPIHFSLSSDASQSGEKLLSSKLLGGSRASSDRAARPLGDCYAAFSMVLRN